MKFLLILLLIILIFRALFRISVSTVMFNNRNQRYQERDGSPRTPEGTMTIKSRGNQKKHLDDKLGEYVDYEEVKQQEP